MVVSAFELFSIGLGPSSSHTVGPMRAAKVFVDKMVREERLAKATALKVELYGSLAYTGVGHGTDKAILLGFEGETPEGCPLEKADSILKTVAERKKISLLGKKELAFEIEKDLLFCKGKFLPFHSNAMKFILMCGQESFSEIYYSIGGGFIVAHESRDHFGASESKEEMPYPFTSGDVLLKICEAEKKSIAEVMRANEESIRSREEVDAGLDRLWEVMNASISRGLKTEGILPGGLKVERRASKMAKKMMKGAHLDPLYPMDWLNTYAMAVNEENAAGGRVVTAPTNGAAGVIPAVIRFYTDWATRNVEEGIRTFLLTAAAIGALYHKNASLSAAEMGCQGEVGVACSMAAAGFAAVLGGTPAQVEEAAEIGMEHNLGLTCDPVGGLVQIPCIERNTMGAVKAVNAAKLALQGEGKHHISLDQVIKTMYQTGKDMQTIYKETSEGGLAVNFVEC